MEDKLLATTWCRALSARDIWRRPSALGREWRAGGWELGFEPGQTESVSVVLPSATIIALGNAVKHQALVMGFRDTFAVVGVVLIIAGIAILLAGKPKGAAAAGGGH
jgi:hypothetical protein